MSAPLAGKAVLVTGASRGIGAATARVIHRDGGTVILHYGSSTVAAETLAAELDGTRVHLVQGDLTESAGARTVWDESVRLAGRVDVLVNNAGAWIASPMDDDAAWEAGWSRNLTLNLTAPADLSRYAINHFRDHGGGAIVNLASRSSHRGDDAEHLAYGAAKGALLALTRGIARGYARENILAYAVAPGWVATDLADNALSREAAAALPLGEVTPPDDVAETIAFLASGRARHATGTTVDITGADYVR
ncbi:MULTISPECIES: SDR family NAD(P)-dependent oxidoreductase [unclassified Rhodococcus (in: high G+C Gram-positive bacteria)]|uniref:SDR family NAD(P)-dependent oxidoreductase n=1 Tax=unclassified Rhodococcus (in: high G+C Gram-positive bacteria) TaxID=192944 RepID=UPI00163A7415|nr:MULTISPECIES: SDR family oxidoreductase [unclassified Rhodococcus (in: high G+C Gram-positive bacteria)]MBC2640842.1 SDR family oxidoreductase [Rhodococcus sp. 3A]MBC2894414.1 SDR family oxidoreductase [Rhodococcus sp. 4CII]